MPCVRLVFVSLTLIACSRLDNHIDSIRLACGSELTRADTEFSLYQIHDAEGRAVDLTKIPYEVFGEGFLPVPSDRHRSTSSGCLQIKKQEKAFLRLQLQGQASQTLMDEGALNQPKLIQDTTPPQISLPVTRSHYQRGEILDVRVNEVSRTRFCIEPAGQDTCSLREGLGLAFQSKSFLDFAGTLRLPDTDGAYQLSLVAEDRYGLRGLLLHSFTVDGTLPAVEVDFSQAEAFLFDGKSHYYLEQGYRLGFRASNESLRQLKIEYCLLANEQSEVDACEPQTIRIFGAENPQALPPGKWILLFRATDLSGNRTPGWDRLRILAKSMCTEQQFLQALEQSDDITCTELSDDLSINRIAVENDQRMRSLVRIRGTLSLIESDRETLPAFPNLRRLSKVEIRENNNLREIDMLPSLISVEDIDIFENASIVKFSGFQQLTSLRNLRIFSGDELQDIQAFDALISIEGTLSLSYLYELKNLNFLQAVQQIDSLSLDNLDNLSSLIALQMCPIKGSIELSSMPSLEDLRGLESTKKLRSLRLADLGIISLAGLEKLEEVEDQLIIRSNSQLTSLDALGSVRLLNRLSIEDNESLQQIDWQAPGEKIQEISIKKNAALTVIKGFDDVTTDLIVRIDSNSQLKAISGWTHLQRLFLLSIKDNGELESVFFGNGLKQLLDSIIIQGNSKLQSLLGFGSLNEQLNLNIEVRADVKPSNNALSAYTNRLDR